MTQLKHKQIFEFLIFLVLRMAKLAKVCSITTIVMIPLVFVQSHADEQQFPERFLDTGIADAFGLETIDRERLKLIVEEPADPQLLQRSAAWICDYLATDLMLAFFDRDTCFTQMIVSGYENGMTDHLVTIVFILEARKYCGIDRPPKSSGESQCIRNMFDAVKEKRTQEFQNSMGNN